MDERVSAADNGGQWIVGQMDFVTRHFANLFILQSTTSSVDYCASVLATSKSIELIVSFSSDDVAR